MMDYYRGKFCHQNFGTSADSKTGHRQLPNQEGCGKPNKLVTSSPGFLHSLINSKEIQGMGLVKQDQRLTRSWLVFFFWLL